MSSTTVTPPRQDPAPDLRTFARTALLVEPLTGGAVWAVLWSSTYLGGLQAAVLATAAALVVAAVAGSSIRVRRRVGGARVAVLVAILLALGGAGVLTASDSLDTPVLPVLTVLCAGPAAWVVLWSDRPATGALRLLIAAALVVPLGFVAFAVGVYATPYVLLTALAVWLAFRTLPCNGAPAEAPAVVGAAAVTAVGSVALAWSTSAGSSVLSLAAFSAPVVAVVLVAVVPDRLPVVDVAVAAVVVVVALAADALVVLPTSGEGGDFGPRLAAGAAVGHLGVMWGAAVPFRRRGAPPTPPGAGSPSPRTEGARVA